MYTKFFKWFSGVLKNEERKIPEKAKQYFAPGALEQAIENMYT
jgi:hypothetical protein